MGTVVRMRRRYSRLPWKNFFSVSTDTAAAPAT